MQILENVKSRLPTTQDFKQAAVGSILFFTPAALLIGALIGADKYAVSIRNQRDTAIAQAAVQKHIASQPQSVPTVTPAP